MRTQQRVRLRYGDAPHNEGTVTRVWPSGEFAVTFDAYRDERGRRVRGGKYLYRAAQAVSFVVLERGHAA